MDDRIELTVKGSYQSYCWFMCLCINIPILLCLVYIISDLIRNPEELRASWLFALLMYSLITLVVLYLIRIDYEFVVLILSFSRKIILNKDGIKICGHRKRKVYKWEELETKLEIQLKYRIFPILILDYLFPKTVVLYPDKISKEDLRGREPLSYLIYKAKNKFSFVFLYYSVKNTSRHYYPPRHYPPVFQVNEEDLKNHLMKWGIELEYYKQVDSEKRKPSKYSGLIIMIIGIFQAMAMLCMGIVFLVNMLTAKPELMAGSREELEVGAHGNVHIDSLLDWYVETPSGTYYVTKLKDDQTYLAVLISKKYEDKAKAIMEYSGGQEAYLDLPGRLDPMNQAEEEEFREYLTYCGLSKDSIQSRAVFLLFDTTVLSGSVFNVTLCFSIAVLATGLSLYLGIRQIKEQNKKAKDREQ